MIFATPIIWDMINENDVATAGTHPFKTRLFIYFLISTPFICTCVWARKSWTPQLIDRLNAFFSLELSPLIVGKLSGWRLASTVYWKIFIEKREVNMHTVEEEKMERIEPNKNISFPRWMGTDLDWHYTCYWYFVLLSYHIMTYTCIPCYFIIDR